MRLYVASCKSYSNNGTKLLFAVAAMIGVFLFAQGVFAAGVSIDPSLHPPGAPTITRENPEEAAKSVEKTPTILTFRIVDVLFGIAGIVAILFIIQNGLFLVASAGAEEVITQRKKGLMWAVTGLILVVLSYSIVRFVISIPFQADQPKSNAAETAAPNAAQ